MKILGVADGMTGGAALIEDGKIVESHEYFDRQEFMSQLGES